ncbi:MAG: hypothetical protein PHN31_00660 [Candidatus Gracilibacteria bacterium]|nr:hypothetical protein [Candidatus Gracilibacteria bacterium]
MEKGTNVINPTQEVGNLNTRTINGIKFAKGNHAIISLADNDEPINGEVTGFGDNSIFINGEEISLIHCINAEKIDLNQGKQILKEFKDSDYNLGKVIEIINNSTSLVLEILLTHINNQIMIDINEVNKIHIPSIDINSNTVSILQLAKKQALLLHEIGILKNVSGIIKSQFDNIKASELTQSIKDGTEKKVD